MLQNTFCHIPGIGPKSERRLWDAGLTGWNAVDDARLARLPAKRRDVVRCHVDASAGALAAGNTEYFAASIPSSETWRMFPEFSHSVAYVDIETTGLTGGRDQITTIAVYDGERIYDFVNGRNLDEFAACIARYKLLVTFNGKTFDVPFIGQALGVKMPRAHIDLRYVLASVGLRGGLKRCEQRLGLDRGDLAGVDGYFAVVLWHEYRRNGNEKALETLLAYNIADVVNLATLMPLAYNMKLKTTPFESTHLLPTDAAPAPSPYRADPETIRRLQRESHWY